MALVFLAGLFDFRRPGRIAHLDLLVLLSFGISQAFFNGGEIGVSVPLVYPALVYLLARMLWIGFRGGGGLRPSLPVRWLGLAAILLIAFRITINIADSGVIDVGYAGTIGADRITHGRPALGRGRVPRRQPLRRHLRSGQLLRLRPLRARLPLERRVGRAGLLARRRARLRPGDDRRPLLLRDAPGRRARRP